MSSIGNLTRQMNQLQSEIARLQRESADRDRKYQQEHQLRMQQLKHTMENALQRHNTQLVQQVQRQMEALNTELMNQIKQNHDSLKRELTQNLEIRHRDLMNQIEQYYQEMQNRIGSEVTDVMKQSETQKQELAQREYTAACGQYQSLTMRAHDELFPGRLTIHQGTLEQAYRMMAEQRQYEASAATSVMLKVNLKDFEYSINDKLLEWLQSYLRMEQSYQKIYGQIDDILTLDGEKINEDTAMYWTSHTYDIVFAHMEKVKQIIDEVEYHQRLVRDEVITAASVEHYIKTGEAPKCRELDENARILKYEIPGKLDDMKRELLSAYHCSAQRKVWAGRIQKYMADKHNTGEPRYNGFYEEKGKMADERAMYCIEFEIPNGNDRMNHYTIHIVPVFVEGEVRNHIRVFMDFRLGSAQYQKKQEIRYISGILHAIGEKKAYIGIGTDEEVLSGSSDEEYSLQPSSNGSGELLIRHSQREANAASQNGSAKNIKSGKQERQRRNIMPQQRNAQGTKIV